MEIKIPISLQQRILYVVSYVGDSTDDWIVVKSEIVRSFPPKERKLFSKRHMTTKKQILNDFDRAVMKYWKEQTGVEPILYDKDKHPEDWEWKPHGWGLIEINEQRKLLSKKKREENGLPEPKKKPRKRKKRKTSKRVP